MVCLNTYKVLSHFIRESKSPDLHTDNFATWVIENWHVQIIIMQDRKVHYGLHETRELFYYFTLNLSPYLIYPKMITEMLTTQWDSNQIKLLMIYFLYYTEYTIFPEEFGLIYI